MNSFKLLTKTCLLSNTILISKVKFVKQIYGHAYKSSLVELGPYFREIRLTVAACYNWILYTVLTGFKFSTNCHAVVSQNQRHNTCFLLWIITNIISNLFILKKKSLFDIIFDVLTAVTMKIIVLLDVTPCSPVEYYRYSGWKNCLHLYTSIILLRACYWPACTLNFWPSNKKYHS